MDQGPLEYGERHTAWRVSYLGHVFELHDPAGHAADPANVPLVYGTYPVKYNSFYALGTFSPPPLPDAAAVARKERQIESTVKFEFERSRSVQRTFTSTGFDRRPLADVDPWIWGSIRAYYNNNRVHGAAREEVRDPCSAPAFLSLSLSPARAPLVGAPGMRCLPPNSPPASRSPP